jgi:hypothetical protein
MLRRLAVAIGVLVSVLMLGGCVMMTQSGGGSSSTGATSSAPQTKATVSAASRVGESQTSGNWKITVNDVQMQNQLADGASAKSGNKLMIADVSFFNVGNTNYLTVAPGQATLTDSKNNVVPMFPTKLGAFNGQSVKAIPVRYGGNTAYVYEVSAGSSGYIFSFKPDPNSNTVLRWRVP